MSVRTSSPAPRRALADGARAGDDVSSPAPRRATAPPPSTPRRGRRDWRKILEIAVLVGPALVIFLGFVIFPVVMAGYYGFFRWKGYGPPTDFIGLQNYVTIFQDPTFHEALWHNVVIVVMSLVLQGPIALLLALLLNRPMRGQSVDPRAHLRALRPRRGRRRHRLEPHAPDRRRAQRTAREDRPRRPRPGLALRTRPRDLDAAGHHHLEVHRLRRHPLPRRACRASPQELTEAAQIDGASYWQIQRRITLPLLGPTLRIWAFLSIIGSLQLFDLVYIIWGQYIASTAGTSTMATYMVANGRNAGNYGYGNAVAVVLFLISLVVALVYQRFVLRRDTAGALTERSER